MMQKKLMSMLLSLTMLLTVIPATTVFGVEDELATDTAQSKAYIAKNTDYPATLAFYLRAESTVGEWNTPKFITFAKSITTGAATSYAKSKAIHDWICTNMAYDDDAYARGELSDNWSVTDMLDKKALICDGFSSLTIAFHRALGIPAKRISGENHAWNEVYIAEQKRWIVMDNTWDCSNWYRDGKFLPRVEKLDSWFDSDIDSFLATMCMTAPILYRLIPLI